jgi:polysaccharide export outer membrane protein
MIIILRGALFRLAALFASPPEHELSATRRPPPLRAAALAFLVGSMFPAAAVSESYQLQRGDVLELFVAGPPNLRGQMPVNIDGNIIAPVAGVIPAAGRTLESVAAAVRDALSSQAFPAVADNGTIISYSISPGAVSVSLLEYRPIYVDGDVGSPGAYPYVPGLSARRAIALAGGYGLGRTRTDNPKLQAMRFKADMEGLTAQRNSLEARLERIRAELQGDDMKDLAEPEDHPDFQHYQNIEARNLFVRRERVSLDEQYLRTAIEKTETHIASLREKLASETEAVEIDQEEVTQLSEARRTGSITSSRLTQVRRDLLFSKVSRSETESDLAIAEREIARLRNELDQRRRTDDVVAVAELSEATVQLAATNAQLLGAARSLLYVRGLAADVLSDAIVTIEIVRTDGARLSLEADGDAPLFPGDLVRVTIDIN